MNMSQDTFNKLITIYLFLFISAVFLYGMISGKTVDWQLFLGFIVPSATHAVHLITGAQLTTENIKSQTAIAVSPNTTNGATTSGGLTHGK